MHKNIDFTKIDKRIEIIFTIILISVFSLVLPVILIPPLNFFGHSEIFEELVNLLIVLFLILKLPTTKLRIYGGLLSGLLFGLSENVFYLNNIFQGGNFDIFWQRFLWTVPMHIITILIILFFAIKSKKIIVFGLLCAIFLHLMFNSNVGQTKIYNKINILPANQIETYKTKCGEYNKIKINFSSSALLANIADNACKRELGLSGMADLIDTGMIFQFENIGNYGFWMKDMNFPIDILWIDDNFKVVGIEKNLEPKTYPKVYGEKYFAKYVLETEAGFSDKNNLKIGETINFTEK